MPFICSLCDVPRNSLGPCFGAFVSSALSEMLTKARKQTYSFVFIASQAALSSSWDPQNKILRADLFTGMEKALSSGGSSQEIAVTPSTLPMKPWLQPYDRLSV